jgi:hypothetical protein
MQNHVARPTRALVGVLTMAVGAFTVVAGLAQPAGAHESEVEPEPVDNGLSCPELAEAFGVDQMWEEFKIDDVANDDFTETYTIDDRGTEDEGDDATVTITVKAGKTFEWESNIGIDAVYVQGRDDDHGAYFYLYAPEADSEEMFSDVDLGTPPWHHWDKNKIKSISFCFDEDHGAPTTSSTTTSTTEAPSTTSTTEAPSTTSTTEAPSSTTSSSVSPTTQTPSTNLSPPSTAPDRSLPITGSSTGPMVIAGLGLLLAGALLVGGTQLWRRFGRSDAV